MPDLAKVIRIEKAEKGKTSRLLIDGEEFPWYTAGGISAHAEIGRELTTVTVKIPCERIEIQDTPWYTPEKKGHVTGDRG
jgi:hypothetical protein